MPQKFEPEHALPLPLGPLLATHWPSSTSYPPTHAVAVPALEHAVANGPHEMHSPLDEVKPLAQMEHWRKEAEKEGWVEVMLGEAQPDEQAQIEEVADEAELEHWPLRQEQAVRGERGDVSWSDAGHQEEGKGALLVVFARTVAVHWPLPVRPSLHLPLSQWLAQSARKPGKEVSICVREPDAEAEAIVTHRGSWAPSGRRRTRRTRRRQSRPRIHRCRCCRRHRSRRTSRRRRRASSKRLERRVKIQERRPSARGRLSGHQTRGTTHCSGRRRP